jgi:UDP-arabinose 4-epimerase
MWRGTDIAISISIPEQLYRSLRFLYLMRPTLISNEPHAIPAKTILVTGGAGYIGSHTCKALSMAGYLPIAYDNLVYGHRDFVKWGPFEQGDIADQDRLQEVIRKYGPEAVVHFAAFAYVGESVEEPAKYYRNNVAGSLTLLEAMRSQGLRKIVFSSSCATYGIPLSLPISENHIQHPVNPYGWSKLVVEQMLKDFDRAYGIRSIALRYFNAAGADPDNEIGEDHSPETHIIPLVLDAALDIRPRVTIFGDDYPTPDGTCIRDYIHVTDLAEAHVLALKKLEAGSASSAFNLGTGLGYSVKEVIAAAEHVTGKRIPTMIGPRRPGDPERLVSDPGSAMRELGWQPRYGDITTILRHAWNWHADRTRTKRSAAVHCSTI